MFGALPIGQSLGGGDFFGDNIPFTNMSWGDFINYQKWKNKLRFGALPIDEQLKEAQLETLSARKNYFETEASRMSSLYPYEQELYSARAKALLPNEEEFPSDLVSALFSYLGLNQGG